MRLLAVPIAAIAIAIAAAATPSPAASPQYCAFYAREYALQFSFGAEEAQTEREILDQAYYRCLNQDEEPALPEHSAYSGSELDAGQGETPPAAQGDADYDEADAVDEDEAIAEAAEEPARTVALVQRETKISRSGLEAWTSKWRTWCQKHFPNSFDPQTGYVTPYEGERGFC